MSQQERRILTIYVDGASRGNPGTSGIGIYCINQDQKMVINAGFTIGKHTNNQAEYLALVYALFFLSKKLSPAQQMRYHLNIIADSQLLIKQMTGEYKIKDPTLKILAEIIKKFCFYFECKFSHVLREFNTNADALANHGIDAHIIPEKDFQELLATHGVKLGLS